MSSSCRYCQGEYLAPLCDPCFSQLAEFGPGEIRVQHPTYEQHPYSPPTMPSSSVLESERGALAGAGIQQQFVKHTYSPSPQARDRDIKDKVLRGIKILAGVCDGARTRDNHGFDGADASFGHSVARQTFISPKQMPICVKLVIKYHRQLPEEIVRAAKEWTSAKKG